VDCPFAIAHETTNKKSRDLDRMIQRLLYVRYV
jgi:hypothetical protein